MNAIQYEVMHSWVCWISGFNPLQSDVLLLLDSDMWCAKIASDLFCCSFVFEAYERFSALSLYSTTSIFIVDHTHLFVWADKTGHQKLIPIVSTIAHCLPNPGKSVFTLVADYH